MSLLNKLQSTELSSLKGKTPKAPDFGNSTLHKEYSLNGVPNLKNKPTPSELDLDGKTPSKYVDNLPR